MASRSACSGEMRAAVGDGAGVASVMAAPRSAKSCVVEARVVVLKNSDGGALVVAAVVTEDGGERKDESSRSRVAWARLRYAGA